jgi:hypothetical protein
MEPDLSLPVGSETLYKERSDDACDKAENEKQDEKADHDLGLSTEMPRNSETR